jgi:hypothetical protein
VNLSDVLRSLPADPRVVVSGNHAVPFHTLALVDAALERYRLWGLTTPAPRPPPAGRL